MATELPPRVWSESFRVRHSEVDRNGNMKLETFSDYFQEVAGNHANVLGCGYKRLRESSRMWVLSRMRLQISRVPEMGETIQVKTWPSGAKRVFAVREALFLDENGCEAARITSYWVMLDLLRERPLRIPDALPCTLPDNLDLPRYFDLSEKITSGNLENPLPFLVTEHMIDVNEHLNNARYCSMTGDWLANAFLHPVKVEDITVSFVAATKAGARLITSGRIEQDNSFTVEIAGADENGSNETRFLASGKVQQ